MENFDPVSWLQLFRAPTLPVFLLFVMAGFLAGGGELFSLTGVAFFAWAWLSHHVTFAHNSLADFLSGHDLKKSPTTRPLVRGSISSESARKVVYLGLALVAISGVPLSLSGRGRASLSLASLLLFYALGHAYNGLSKFTRWSFPFVSLAFACLPAFSYFAAAETAGVPLAVIMGFVALTMCFETVWEGSLKDIGIDENSLLQDLGVGLSNGKLEVPPVAKAFAWGLKLSGLAVVTYGVLWQALTPWTALGWGVLAGIAVISAYELTVNQEWEKKRIKAYTGVEEIACSSLLLVMVAPVSGWTPVLLLVAFGFLWVPIAVRIYTTRSWSMEVW